MQGGKTSGSKQTDRGGPCVCPALEGPVISAFPSRGNRRVRSRSGAVQLPKPSGAAHFPHLFSRKESAVFTGALRRGRLGRDGSLTGSRFDSRLSRREKKTVISFLSPLTPSPSIFLPPPLLIEGKINNMPQPVEKRGLNPCQLLVEFIRKRGGTRTRERSE